MERSQPARRLPPLNALRFFEAAGRLQSVRQAAAELYGPEYCARHQITGPRDLLRLGSAELLRSLASPRLWQGWLEMAGIPSLVPDCGPTYSDSVLTCRAAAAGQGVALAPRSLVEADLAAGLLVVPFTLKNGYQIFFYLVYRPGEQRSRAFRAFREWLLTQTRSGRERSEAEAVARGA